MASEKRLIDANNLLEKHVCDVYGAYDDSCMVQAVFVPYIKGAPTVDAVEVVRCKDCKHWHEETGWCDHHSHFIGVKGEACHPWESSDWKMLNEDDFCSYGERRSDG